MTPPELWENLVARFELSGLARQESMMGSPCLRVRGEFIGMLHVKTQELIVKLPANRVDELVAEGVGVEFSSAGRVFKEWMAVPEPHEQVWEELLEEALEFAAAG